MNRLVGPDVLALVAAARTAAQALAAHDGPPDLADRRQLAAALARTAACATGAGTPHAVTQLAAEAKRAARLLDRPSTDAERAQTAQQLDHAIHLCLIFGRRPALEDS
ncbi:MAG: hypothetical protein QM658_04060 [Gordonia sp. (in: high G+C Gram-positive bacteria)]